MQTFLFRNITKAELLKELASMNNGLCFFSANSIKHYLGKTMQAYYEIETDIPVDHQLHINLPENIPAGRAKIAVIYELTQIKNDAGVALKAFLNKYQAEDIDIDTSIFEENRKTDADRDFRL